MVETLNRENYNIITLLITAVQNTKYNARSFLLYGKINRDANRTDLELVLYLSADA